MFSDSLPGWSFSFILELLHHPYNRDKCSYVLISHQTILLIFLLLRDFPGGSLGLAWTASGENGGVCDTHRRHVEVAMTYCSKNSLLRRRGQKKNITFYWFSCRPLRTSKWTKASTQELSLSAGSIYRLCHISTTISSKSPFFQKWPSSVWEGGGSHLHTRSSFKKHFDLFWPLWSD